MPFGNASDARRDEAEAAADMESTITEEHVVCVPAVEPYQPGAFYVRELPALQAVLAVCGRVDMLIIDGYVDLDPSGRPGLGSHAHEALELPIVGVAKAAFRSATHAIPVLRGRSTRPLYVTAAGLEASTAAAFVRDMAGAHRLPDALRRVDQLTRTGYARGPT